MEINLQKKNHISEFNYLEGRKRHNKIQEMTLVSEWLTMHSNKCSLYNKYRNFMISLMNICIYIYIKQLIWIVFLLTPFSDVIPWTPCNSLPYSFVCASLNHIITSVFWGKLVNDYPNSSSSYTFWKKTNQFILKNWVLEHF